MSEGLEGIQRLLQNNREWAVKSVLEKPSFFIDLAKGQSPEYLWIGCADSRVPANLLTGTTSGQVFTHRNVGNIVSHSDLNCMSAIEYSVLHLGVKHVVVCGHYGCGAVNAALTMPLKTAGVTNCWISHIREVRNAYTSELKYLDPPSRLEKLCELSAVKQAFNVCTSPTIQTAWDSGKKVYVHAVIFDLSTGRLKRLAGPIGSLEQAKLIGERHWDTNETAESPRKAGVNRAMQEKIIKDLNGVLRFEAGE